MPSNHRCSALSCKLFPVCSPLGECFQSSVQLLYQQSPLRLPSQVHGKLEHGIFSGGVWEIHRKPVTKAGTSYWKQSNFMAAQGGICWGKFEALWQSGEHCGDFTHQFVVTKDLLSPFLRFTWSGLEILTIFLMCKGCRILATSFPTKAPLW